MATPLNRRGPGNQAFWFGQTAANLGYDLESNPYLNPSRFGYALWREGYFNNLPMLAIEEKAA